ncbi:MAG: DUF2099 family protein, partial [Methanomassiliicoccales archaeon]|nr:DUF2099 family protein [Methanomassiliicoccales archaeon]
RKELYGCEEESKETVERVLRKHMDEYGMYGSDRILESHEKPVSFGASEIIMDAMLEGLVDAAVVVCEGAGTVVVHEPNILQAIGAHMTGLISTDPIPEVISKLKEKGCLVVDEACTIDQVQGFRRAVELGFRKIVVTITGQRADDAKLLKEMGDRLGVRPIVFAVHNTGIGEREARTLAEYADVVWGCASRSVREVVGKVSKIQIGVAIPVFAVSEIGKRLVLNRAYHFEGSLVIHRALLPFGYEDRRPEPLL